MMGKRKVQRFVRGSIYRVLRTLFWKYVSRSFYELPHIEYTKRYLFHSQSLNNSTDEDTKVIACPTWIRSKTIRTFAIPRLPNNQHCPRKRGKRRTTSTVHVVSVHSSVAVVYLTE